MLKGANSIQQRTLSRAIPTKDIDKVAGFVKVDLSGVPKSKATVIGEDLFLK